LCDDFISDAQRLLGMYLDRVGENRAGAETTMGARLYFKTKPAAERAAGAFAIAAGMVVRGDPRRGASPP
jgi:hypothetical protein